MMEVDNKYLVEAIDWAIGFAPKLLFAILILGLGLWFAKKLSKVIRFSLSKANLGLEIEDFLASLFDMLLKIVVLLAAVATVGVKVSALFGVLAAAGFAVGLALQGFLGNFASGLTLVFFKPYKVGDWVSIADTFGSVKSIQIFSTELITPGEKTVIIPNGQVTDNIIVNYSTRGKIRLELQITMPYSESFPRIKQIIQNALKEVDLVLQDPAPKIGIEAYDTHNIVVGVKPFILPDHFWDATFEVYEAIKKSFSENDIQVAYSEGVEMGKIGE